MKISFQFQSLQPDPILNLQKIVGIDGKHVSIILSLLIFCSSLFTHLWFLPSRYLLQQLWLITCIFQDMHFAGSVRSKELLPLLSISNSHRFQINVFAFFLDSLDKKWKQYRIPMPCSNCFDECENWKTKLPAWS